MTTLLTALAALAAVLTWALWKLWCTLVDDLNQLETDELEADQ